MIKLLNILNEIKVNKPITIWDFTKYIPNFNPTKIKNGDIVKIIINGKKYDNLIVKKGDFFDFKFEMRDNNSNFAWEYTKNKLKQINSKNL